MASNGSQPTSSVPMVSVEEPVSAVSAPNPSIPSSIPASSPSVSEPTISQVQSLAPIVSGFDPNLHGRLTNEQIRQGHEEAARRGFEEGSRHLQRALPSTGAYGSYTSITSNPFETGTAFSTAPQINMGPYPISSSSEVLSQPSAQRIFPVLQGVSPSSHDASLVVQQANVDANLGTPFTLGNRAPRNATSNSGGMRRRLDSAGLKNIRYEPQAGVVASNQKIRAVGVALIGMGIPEHQLTEVGVYLARHCADVGASDKSTLLGTFPGSDITLEEVGTMIKQTEGCTLRQYCAFYAKHVWNLMLQTQSPPANWVGKEFKFETRYAAFDFFFGVESTASLEPADGLIRLPTQAERVANATSKEIQMYRIRSMEGTQAVNFGEVTGGKIGPKPVLSIRK